jgi:hypothetical protein
MLSYVNIIKSGDDNLVEWKDLSIMKDKNYSNKKALCLGNIDRL